MPRIFTLFAFIALTTTNLHAYLDPGTGSLLLSSVVAIFASFIYFFKNLFYKVVSLSSKSPKSSLVKFGMGGGNRPTLNYSNQNLCSFDNKDYMHNSKHSYDSHTTSLYSTTPFDSIVFYCEGRQYYNTFKPILDTLDCLKHPYTYLTSDEGDPALKRESNNFSIKEFIGVGNSAYTRLNFLKADICVLTTPSLQVLQIKRSRAVKHYCHIVHSLTPMTYRAFGVDYFDSVLVANEIQSNFVRQIEKVREVKRKYIAITGLTYLDELANLRKSIKDNNNKTTSAEVSLGDFVGCEATSKENKTDSLLTKRVANSRKSVKETTHTILVSPSWGKETLLSKYGLRLLEPLAKSPYHIIIRPHPQSLVGEVESNNIKYLQNALKDYNNVEWDIGTPNVIAFQKADLMISDFSSVIFDFVCLESKPVLTLDFTFDSAGYDLADIYNENNINEFWTFKALNQIGGKISEGDFPRIQNIIDSALQSNANKDALAKIKNTLWCYPHNSGTQATLEILKIQRYLLESQLDKNLLNRLDLTKNAIESLKNAKDSTPHKGFNND